MYSDVDSRSRLETIFAILSAIVVVSFSFLAWFAVVGLALLYACGVKLPGTSTQATAIIFFFVGAVGMLYLVSLAFGAWYLYRRRFARRQGYCLYYPNHCKTEYHQHHQSPKPSTSLTSFTSDFQMLANLDSLTPHLCKRGLIHASEMEGLLQAKLSFSRSYQMLHILTILEKKGKLGVDGMIEALKDDDDHMGHSDLADLLIKAYQNPHPCKEKTSEYTRSQSYA